MDSKETVEDRFERAFQVLAKHIGVAENGREGRRGGGIKLIMFEKNSMNPTFGFLCIEVDGTCYPFTMYKRDFDEKSTMSHGIHGHCSWTEIAKTYSKLLDEGFVWMDHFSEPRGWDGMVKCPTIDELLIQADMSKGC